MTNETTASPPKSIGDDAKFVGLLKRSSELYNMSAAYENGYGEATAALVSYLNSKLDSRAPAAQASATIQAAPDKAIDEANKLATLAAWFKEGKLPDNIYWKVGVTAEAMRRVFSIAAPMVADPAGVAWDYATMGIPNEEVTDMWRAAGHSGTVPFSFANRIQERMQAALAATVKSVPSEALDAAGWLYGNGFYEVGNPRLTDHIREHGRALFAAPLADKTDGAQ